MEKFRKNDKKGSFKDLEKVHDLTASQSRGDLKYQLESIKESIQESQGKDSSIKESIGKASQGSSDPYYHTTSQKRASTKYEDDFEDASITISKSMNDPK